MNWINIINVNICTYTVHTYEVNNKTAIGEPAGRVMEESLAVGKVTGAVVVEEEEVSGVGVRVAEAENGGETCLFVTW